MIEPAEESRLLGDLRAGGDARDRALGELYERTRAPLYSLALRMTGRPDLAEDALQETFVDVLRGLDGFRGSARLTTWLFRVAVRAAARASARAAGRATALPGELPGAAGAPPDELAEREGAARLLAAIARLPARLRAVLALSALGELPQTEVAAVLGLPAGTVYSRLHEARERLRGELARGAPGPDEPGAGRPAVG